MVDSCGFHPLTVAHGYQLVRKKFSDADGVLAAICPLHLVLHLVGRHLGHRADHLPAVSSDLLERDVNLELELGCFDA